jgi:hypothetical protein
MADGGSMRQATAVDLDESDWISIEAIVLGWTARAGFWLGTGGGPRTGTVATWERAAFACRRIERFDLALLLWSNGVEDAAVARDALGILRADAARIEAAERAQAPLRSRCWPSGRRQALAWLAAQELRPGVRGGGLMDSERLAMLRLGVPGLEVGPKNWSLNWSRRYAALVAKADRRVGSALGLVRGNREG